jgi:hypothetical protein
VTDLDLQVTDNSAIHEAPLIRNWYNRRRRWHIHLTPTSSGLTANSDAAFTTASPH